jgi:hypothetical protein
MEDDDENGSNIFDNSVTPSKYIKLLIREWIFSNVTMFANSIVA